MNLSSSWEFCVGIHNLSVKMKIGEWRTVFVSNCWHSSRSLKQLVILFQKGHVLISTKQWGIADSDKDGKGKIKQMNSELSYLSTKCCLCSQLLFYPITHPLSVSWTTMAPYIRTPYLNNIMLSMLMMMRNLNIWNQRAIFSIDSNW